MSSRLLLSWFLSAVAVALPDAGVAEVPPPEDAPPAAPAANETVVTARRPYTAASSRSVRSEDFATRPLTDASDLLEVTPGLLTVQHAGGGKANQYFVRGFDIDHGTDLALSVDGMPVNMVSHGHGQGYADLHFVIPETIAQLEVTKGPYAAEHGDFATAGAVELVTRRQFDRSFASAGYGAFDTWRLLGVVTAHASESPLSGYAAAEVFGSNGPFVSPERLQRFNLLARGGWRLGGDAELSLTLRGYGADWNASGQLPLRAVEAGALDRFGSVDPTEGGQSQRHSAQLELRQRADDGGEWRLRGYLALYRFALFSNFTFFANDPVQGDQIEQTDRRTLAGFEARHERPFSVWGISSRVAGGLRLRQDDIDNGLFHAVRRERLAPRVDAEISEGALGVFVEADTEWTPWLRTVLGARADHFGFQVTDRLEDLAEPGSTSGVTRALRLSPKASLVLSPVRAVDVYLNFGRGFHSNDARGVVRSIDPVTALTAATGYEVGIRTRLWRRLDLAAAAWALELDSELVWVGDEGTTEARPATRRRGVEAELRYRILPWLRADADVTWTHARFTAETGGGRLVPLAPTWTWAGGLSAEHPSGFFANARVRGLADRPANETGELIAQGFTLVDLEVGYEGRHFRLAATAQNLLDTPWRQAQFANESRLPDEAEAVEDLHFTPGHPRMLGVSVTGYF